MYTVIGIATTLFILVIYYYEIVLPVKREKPRPTIIDRNMSLEWMDFIHANIYSSYSAYHCHQCRKLIILFDQRFRKEVHPEVFNEWINNMYNRLDNKYKAILTEDISPGNMTIDTLLK